MAMLLVLNGPPGAASRRAGGACGLADTWDQLQEVVARRPRAVVVRTKHGDIEGAYAAVVASAPRPA